MVPKFRAWHKEKKLIYHVTHIFWSYDGLGAIKGLELLSPRMGLFFSTTPDEVVLMQSTGLKDKNGVEIFERDVLNSPLGNVEILWRNAQWVVNDETEAEYWPLTNYAPKSEVIGNVYENGELVKAGE